MTQALKEIENNLSKNIETLGFDLISGKTWIYPTNFQVRDYQYKITEAALYKNTLVSLPTGLGKTFIAAVVMYNFYRWYPNGKIIFMAPTKPLVKQQQDACYNIVAIPPEHTTELTGTKIKTSRVKIWKDHRVFFITPQILQNDIEVVLNLAQQIKCIVIDEAHKAQGKNANCEAIKKIHKINKNFRILALSATPGSNFTAVKDIITNLLISHIEVRTNESADVIPYIFQRKLETFVIPITGELLNVKNKYIIILDKYVRPLLQFNIISGNCANLSKGKIVITLKEFKEKGRHHTKYGYILKTLTICVALYHAYELLIRHGLRNFLTFFNDIINKPLLNSINELHEVIEHVRSYLGPVDEVIMLPDGTIPVIKSSIIYSHPKFEKLSEILKDHFTKNDADTKVMVFCEYRESAMEIFTTLLRQKPIIKPRIFIGQGAISQAKQLKAVKEFKSGECNTLISTCIGEEGLDVGEVDLIVCFDISSKSPIRMVQRMGRTGRKRDGRVVILVTEGKEQQLLNDCLTQKDNMSSVLESNNIKQFFYADNPRMIPKNIHPECNKLFITKRSPEPKNKIKKSIEKLKNTNTIKDMFENAASQSLFENPTNPVKQSKTIVKCSPIDKKSKKLRNQMDIRNMFSKISSSENSSQMIEDSDSNVIVEDELQEITIKAKKYLNKIKNSKCMFCDIFNCKYLCSNLNEKVSETWTEPDESILSILNAETFKYIVLEKEKSYSTINEDTKSSLEEILRFFSCTSLNDIFSDDLDNSDEVIENNKNQTSCENKNDVSYISEYENQNLKYDSEKSLFLSDSFNINDDFTISNLNLNVPKQEFYEEIIESKPPFNNIPQTQLENLVNLKPQQQESVKEFHFKVSTPKLKISQEDNYKIWDDTLFENCSSDDCLKIEKEKLEIDEDKSDDSDATVVLTENKLISNDVSRNETAINNSSLLSITKAIEFLNKSEMSKTIETKNQKTDDMKDVYDNKKIISVDLNEDIKDIFIESDDDFSLLSFSQNRKRKLITQSQSCSNSNNNIQKSQINFEISCQILEKSDSEVKRSTTSAKEIRTNSQNIPIQKQNDKIEIETQKNSKSKLKMKNNTKLSLNNKQITEDNQLELKKDSELKNNLFQLPSIPISKRQISSDSDDDFEDPKTKPTSKLKRIKSFPLSNKQTKNITKNRSKSSSSSKSIPKKKTTISEFIDDMAEVELDENYVSDSCEEEENDMELSFVSFTQTVLENTDMTAKYLQSIKSPRFKAGMFKIPEKPPPIYEDVFSQVENCENDTYVNDSFCVGNDVTLTQRNGLSYLESIENQLEQRKRTRNKIRKRIVTISDSD